MGKMGEMSTRSRIEYDCKEEQYRFIQISYFPEKFATGSVLLIHNYQINIPGGEWSQIAPGTVDESLFQFVCANWIHRKTIMLEQRPLRFQRCLCWMDNTWLFLKDYYYFWLVLQLRLHLHMVGDWMQTVATTIVKLVTTTATDHRQRPQHSNNSKLIPQAQVADQPAM